MSQYVAVFKGECAPCGCTLAVVRSGTAPSVRNCARLDGRCSTTGTLCLCISTLPIFFFLHLFLSQCRRVLTRCCPAEKKSFEREEERKGERGKSGQQLPTVPVLIPESLSSSGPPDISPPSPPFGSLNGRGSFGVCSSAGANTLEAASVWRVDRGPGRTLRNARLPRWSSALSTFAFPFWAFFYWRWRETLLTKFTTERKSEKKKWQLSHFSPRYGLFIFIDVLFTLSSMCGPCSGCGIRG